MTSKMSRTDVDRWGDSSKPRMYDDPSPLFKKAVLDAIHLCFEKYVW